MVKQSFPFLGGTYGRIQCNRIPRIGTYLNLGAQFDYRAVVLSY